MDILIFKTNVSEARGVDEVSPHLESLRGIHRYTFDLDDIDKVLRVEARGLTPGNIESAVKTAGYFCEELPD